MKIVSTKLLSLFVTITLLLSCEHKVSLETPQETPVSFVQNTDRLDVSKAQFWFEQSVNQPNKAARTNSTKPIKKAHWEAAMQMFSTKRGQYLQVPISYDNVKSLTYSEKKNGKMVVSPVPTEMLYIYNEKGKYDYYVVELLPDEEYLKKIEKKKVKLFNKREYSGYFFIKDWNDAPKEGWYMKNGKVVRQLSPTTIKKNGRLMGCDWFTRFHFSFGCVTGGGGNGGGDVIIFGTSFVIQGNDPSAGPSLAFTLPLPEGHACAYNQWQFTEADVFIDCNFDGGVPDPMEDFPFIPYLNGPGNAYVVWGTVAFVEYLELGFALNIQERNFYASMSWLVPQAMNNRFAAKDAIDYFYCVDAYYFNGNAFKHAYWSALNTWAFGADVARTMG